MQVATQEKPDIRFLKPGFTAIPNTFWKVLTTLKLSELNLLLVLYRYISGYLKTGTVIGEAILLEETNLSRATLYEAKNRLLELGYITITHTSTGRCYYEIAPHLQAVLSDEERKIQGGPSAGTDPHPSGPPDPTLYKERKEKKDQHHYPQLPPTPPPPGNDDEPSISKESSNGRPSHALVNQLKSYGVTEFVAFKLAKTHSEEIITQALSRLKQVQAQNPAGYLVSEISRGGYGQPIKDTTRAIREEHAKINDLRRQERQQEEQAKEQSANRVARLLDQFAQLSPDQQRPLLSELHQQAQQEGFSRLPGWAESHPTYRGLLAEIVARHLVEVRTPVLRE